MSFETDQRFRQIAKVAASSLQPKYKQSGRNDLWEKRVADAKRTLRKLDARLGYWENNERPPFDYEFDSEDYDHPDYKEPFF